MFQIKFGTLHGRIAGVFCLLVCVAAFTVGAAAQRGTPSPSNTPPPLDTDVVKISTNLIQLDMTVVDAKGKVVRDLRPDEIEVFENGQKQKITNFSFVSAERNVTEKNESKAAEKDTVPVPAVQMRHDQVRRTIALVVDDLTLSFESAYQARRALKKFVDEQMLEGDLVAIIRTGAGIGALQQFTSDKTMLYAAIERVKWNPNGNGGLAAFGPVDPSFADLVKGEGGELKGSEPGNLSQGSAAWDDFQKATYATGTLAALRYVVTGMSELPGRKSVILFSEGWEMLQQDEHGFTISGNVEAGMKKLVEDANRASVVFYTVDTRGLVYTGPTAADKQTTATASGGTAVPSPQAYSRFITDRTSLLHDTQAGLDFLAEETGGLSIKNTNDIVGGVRKVMEDQSYYLIAYEPDSDTFDPKTRKFNKIEIKVNRKGLTARYRSGFSNVADSAKPKTTAASTPALQLQHALMSPFAVNDISLHLNALFGSQPAGSYVRSLLHIDAKDLKFTDEPDGSKKMSFDVWAASFGDNGAVVDQITKTYNLTVKPSGYQKILDNGFIYHFTFPVKKAGGYQYRVAIRDAQSNKVGSASQFIQVPDLKKGRLTTSSIVLENMPAKAWEELVSKNGEQLQSSSQADTALRRVKLGSILRYGFEVYNAKLGSDRKPSLQSRIRVFLDGKLILDGKPVPVDLRGQTDLRTVIVSGALSLGDKMAPGDYILQVIVTDGLAKKGRQIAAQHVQFEVVP
jgi:VWFA-related protein